MTTTPRGDEPHRRMSRKPDTKCLCPMVAFIAREAGKLTHMVRRQEEGVTEGESDRKGTRGALRKLRCSTS